MRLLITCDRGRQQVLAEVKHIEGNAPTVYHLANGHTVKHFSDATIERLSSILGRRIQAFFYSDGIFVESVEIVD